MKKISCITFAVVMILFSFNLFAQQNPDLNEDDVFGEETFVSPDESNTNEKGFLVDAANASVIFKQDRFRIGGSFTSKLELSSIWKEPYKKNSPMHSSFTNPYRKELLPEIGTDLFFDARLGSAEKEDVIKFFGKVHFDLPLPDKNGEYNPNFKLVELYTDFSINDIAFFRFGKHAVKWGVGKMFSPADIINVSLINPENYSKGREGPISLRTHIIIPETMYNFWLYVLPDIKTRRPEDTAGAAKAELVFGGWEFGIGGWYKYEKAPRLSVTISGTLGKDVPIFAEGVFSWGSDYTYHRIDASLSPYTVKDKPFFQATLGASYTFTESHTMILVQYYYNGLGYANPHDLKSRLKPTKPLPLEVATAINNTEAMQRDSLGQHYIGMNIMQSKIGTEKITANAYQLFEIGELSAKSSLSFNFEIKPPFHVIMSMATNYPLTPSSLAPSAIMATLAFTFGGGRF